jgi:carboxymethylenebutenolidase
VLRDGARRLAKDGFAVVLPDLYARFDAPDGDVETDIQAFFPFAKRLDASTVEPDVRAAAHWLKERFPNSKTAVAGFCMGGVIALHRAAGHADLFAAAAVWYGHPDVANVNPHDIDIPLVASYGADDAHIPVERVEAFFKQLRVPNDLKIYPNAGHAFCDRSRTSYEPLAAEDSYHRTVDFLTDVL